MNDIDPKILELRRRDFGENCELVKRTEWSYSFKCGEKSYGSISRFMAEPGFRVSASDIRQRWPGMSERERTDFASNFHLKAEWLEKRYRDSGNNHAGRERPHLDFMCAANAEAPRSEPGRGFLIERVRRWESEDPPLNYMQALGLAGDPRAALVVRPYYDKCLKAMEMEAATGVPNDVFFGPVAYHAFLAIAGDLFKITHSEEYEQAIRKYFDHPSEQVRWWAEHALDVEGPTTLRRNAEYAKKRRL